MYSIFFFPHRLGFYSFQGVDHILKQLSENSDSFDVTTILITDGAFELMPNLLKEGNSRGFCLRTFHS